MNAKKKALRQIASALYAKGCNCAPDITIEKGIFEIRHDDWCAFLKKRGDHYALMIDSSKDGQEN